MNDYESELFGGELRSEPLPNPWEAAPAPISVPAVVEVDATPIVPPAPSAEVQRRATNPLDLPVEVFQAGLDRRRVNHEALIRWVRKALVEGTDYGSIPTSRGPSKPSLWKPGAEKIGGMLGVNVVFPSLELYEQAALRGENLDTIILKCHLTDSFGNVLAEGIGARSISKEKGDVNKAMKMAAKSAHIDATLRLAGLSEVFTQDLEDMVEVVAPRAPQKEASPEGDDRTDDAPEAKSSNLIEYVKGECSVCGSSLIRAKTMAGRSFVSCELAQGVFNKVKACVTILEEKESKNPSMKGKRHTWYYIKKGE